MRTRTLCGVLLMCMAGLWRGHAEVKSALFHSHALPCAAHLLTLASTPAQLYGPAHEQLSLPAILPRHATLTGLPSFQYLRTRLHLPFRALVPGRT